MARARRLDCENRAPDCRFIVQLENEGEVFELNRTHVKDVHGQEYSEDELENDRLEAV